MPQPKPISPEEQALLRYFHSADTLWNMQKAYEKLLFHTDSCTVNKDFIDGPVFELHQLVEMLKRIQKSGPV